ncbi:MAG: hypothetical protein JW876_04315 [Candidatus Krumholzibacteriota bacterium]|nr:hypothetical protein [Candidatus Krumholzibacteriota bacterium]
MKRDRFTQGWIVALLLCAAGAAWAATPGTRILSSTASSVTFEIALPAHEIVETADGARVVVPGFGTFSPPGSIEVPGRLFPVAVPPSGEVRTSWRILSSVDLGPLDLARVRAERFVPGAEDIPATESFLPADPRAGLGLPAVVDAGRPSMMGRLRVLPVRVNALVGEAGSYALVTRLSVTVTWTAPAPGGGGLDAPLTGAWRSLYDRTLVNPGAAASLRRPVDDRRPLGLPAADVKRLKIHVGETGIYALRADSLIACGMSPGLAVDGFALRMRYPAESGDDPLRIVEVPAFVLENPSANGILDGDDRIFFYARHIKDDGEAMDVDARFTDHNVVWLDEETAGAFMAEGIAPAGGVAPAPFRARAVAREDAYYHKRNRPGNLDFYYILFPERSVNNVPVHLRKPADAVAAVAIDIQGADRNSVRQRLAFSINGHALGTDSISSYNSKTEVFPAVPGEWLLDGENTVTIATDEDWGVLVDEVRVDYTGRFEADGDRLEFETGLSILGMTAVIPGFTAAGGILFDITETGAPTARVLDPADFVDAGGGLFTLTLDVQPSMDVRRRFAVIGERGAMRVPNRLIEADAASRLLDERGPFNAIMIVHGDFMAEAEVYAEYRRNQGYRILVADVADVFDEFNGGRPHIDAIRRFVARGVDRWGVEYVLLVGDSSEDRKGTATNSPPDFVPSYTYCTSVLGTYFYDEVVSTDRYYSFLDESPPGVVGGPLDGGFPDVFVGRIPVGSGIELRAVRIKMERFETAEPGETWRRRVLLFADDAWSGGGNDYRRVSGEDRFESSMGLVGDSIEEALPGGFDIQRLWLSTWTETPHLNPAGDPGSQVYSRTVDSVRTYFSSYLDRKLNEGCLFYSFQGHGNRSTLTTEAAFASLIIYDDIDSLRTDRQHLFIGIGCHISEFARASELSRAIDGKNGDCLTEQLLFKPLAGAVGTYASTGYEYLGENAIFCETLHEVLFAMVPTDSVPPEKEYTGAHWTFGEALVAAETEHIVRRGAGAYEQVFRYLLLGDPMTKIDPGAPLMKLFADWGSGFVETHPDSFRAVGGSNRCRLRFEASDVVALEGIGLEIDGEDVTDSLETVRLGDEDLTYARRYRAELDYTVALEDEALLFRVFKPVGIEAGYVEVAPRTTIRLFFNDDLEIMPGGNSPPTGDFRVEADFPAYIDQAPLLFVDGVRFDRAVFAVPDPADSLHWEATFAHTFAGGENVLTVRVGEFSRDFIFTTGGNQFTLDGFNFPNPFDGGTNIVFTLNLGADSGEIDIYNVSGVRIRRLAVPADRLDPGKPNTIWWDGRDSAGGRVANGTYLYMIRVRLGGEERTVTGTAVKLE